MATWAEDQVAMGVPGSDGSRAGRLNANADERIGVGQFAHGIGKDQRSWADLKTRPMERALSDIIRNRMTGDQSNLVGSAQKSVFDSYDKSSGSATRNAARYGVKLDPSADRGFGLDRTKSAIQAGNLAAQADRDGALLDAQRFYRSGSGLPGMATQEYTAGGGSIVDQKDYISGMGYGKDLGDIDARRDIGSALASALPFADGGVVGGIGGKGRVLEGEAERVELESGDFIVPEHAMEFYGREFWDKLVADNGGDISDSEAMETESPAAESAENGYADGGAVLRAPDTARLKNKHTEEYGQGKTDKQFPEWLKENGYELGDDNQAAPQSTAIAKAEPRKTDDRPRTPDFLFQPREYQKKPDGYADGGGVGFGVGIEQGYAGSAGPIVGAVKKGLTAGLLDARDTEKHEAQMADRKEDRGYLREDRAYQGKQRALAEQQAIIKNGVNKAGGAWLGGDGGDLQSLVDVNAEFFGGKKAVISRGADKSVIITGTDPDGNPLSETMTLEEGRNRGAQMYQVMSDPQAYMKELNGKPDTVTAADGAVVKEKNRRTGKWETVTDNPKDPRKEAAGKYNPLSNANAISRLIGERLGGKYDDITGKMIKPPDDPELATALTAAGHEYERMHPGERLPGEVVKMVFDKTTGVMREDDAKKTARQEIRDKTGYFSTDETDLGMPRKDYEAKRVRELTGGGFGLGKPAAKPAGQQGRAPDQVKSDFKAGKITREQAKKELKAMGFN